MKVSHLARAIHPSRSKLKLMLGLSAYFDESGHADDPECRFVGVGGLCAPVEAWTEFDSKWNQILDELCGGHPFHMNKFALQQPPYDGWTKKQREELLGRLVRTIKDAGARPLGAVVNLDAYEQVCKAYPGAENVLGTPYHMGFRDATWGAAISVLGFSFRYVDDLEQMQEFERTESVSMVYAYQKEYGTVDSKSDPSQRGQSEKIWHWIKENNPYVGRWMGSYASASPNDLNFLQAADLFAYELTHEFENRMKRPTDKMRWALSEMLPNTWRDFLHKFYDVPQILEILVTSGWLGATEYEKNSASISNSMHKIMHGDLLAARMYDRRWKQ